MRKSVLKTVTAFALCAVTALCAVLTCTAAEYTIAQIDDMTLTLPDGMSAVTRDSQSSDKYFSAFNLDYETTMKSFENNDIYLQGMDSMSSMTLTVTMTKNENSENLNNYASLSSSDLSNVRTSFLSTEGYGSCTDLKTDKNLWLVFDVTETSGSSQVKTFVANTVYDGMNINISMKRTEGDVTSVDSDTFSQIISSVTFSDLPVSKSMLPYVLAGGAVLILLFIILIIVFAVRIRKHKKTKKNTAIIEELADKYSRGRSNGKDADEGYDITEFESAYDESESAYGETRYADIETESEYSQPSRGRRYAPEPVVESFDEPDEITASYRNIDSADNYIDDSEIDDILNSVRAHRTEAEPPAASNYRARRYGAEPEEQPAEHQPANDEPNGFEKKNNLGEDGTSESEKEPQQVEVPTETPKKEPLKFPAGESTDEQGVTMVIPEPEHDLFETGEPDDMDRESDAAAQEAQAQANAEKDSEPKKISPVKKQRNKLEKKVDDAADLIFGSPDPEEMNGNEVGDEELVREEAQKSKFDSGYDFFEEAPKKSSGTVMTADLSDLASLADAEDVDVIGEVEQKAEQVKKAADTESQADGKASAPKAGEGLKKAGGALAGFGRGVKNFGIHCGYFCQNVSRMIKRKRRAAKRKKAEEARRANARARQQSGRPQSNRPQSSRPQQRSSQNGELIQLHKQSSRSSQSGKRPTNGNKRK